MINWSGALRGRGPTDGKDAPSADWCRRAARHAHWGDSQFLFFCFETGDLRFPDTCQEDSSSTDPHVMPLEAACSDMDALCLSF